VTEHERWPRALFVDLSLQFGGASVRAADLVRGGSAAGWGLAVLEGSPAWQHAVRLGLTVYSVGQRRADPGIVRRLGRIIQAHGYQIVDAQNPQAKLWGALAAWRQGTAFVSTLNSWPRSEYGHSLRGYAYVLLERLLRARTHMQIAVSGEIFGQLREQGVRDARAVHIPAAVELRKDDIAADRTIVRRKFNLPDEAQVCSRAPCTFSVAGQTLGLASLRYLAGLAGLHHTGGVHGIPFSRKNRG